MRKCQQCDNLTESRFCSDICRTRFHNEKRYGRARRQKAKDITPRIRAVLAMPWGAITASAPPPRVGVEFSTTETDK